MAPLLPEKVRLILSITPIILRYIFTLLGQRIQATIHKYTFHQTPNPKQVVVLGGSFAGLVLARRLAESLPSGYKAVVIEKNSHFNYVFNFPRYSVVEGRESKAFIPYEGVFSSAPKGISEIVQGEVVGISETHVTLMTGEKVEFEYLAIATGAKQPVPARLLSSERDGGCKELRELQEKIKKARRIGIIGGGAVGVQLAGDISTFHSKDGKSEKEIVLVHSRDRLLNNFGERLGLYVEEKMKKLGVEVVLGERPVIGSEGREELVFGDGRRERFDLIIPCVGQTPNSSILNSFSPSSISNSSGRILVSSTLQVQNSEKSDGGVFKHVFALGDVAETSGPKMARAGMMQAEIVRDNIAGLIAGKEKGLKEYKPMAMEGALKLSLGKNELAMFMQDENGSDYLFPAKGGNVDLEVERAWKMFGANFPKK
ncbi:putative amid-like NADH oxidoreductase [Halenospora varia]|nr:putative amid-like NADH oxidoreductase [Halenospora varia]